MQPQQFVKAPTVCYNSYRHPVMTLFLARMENRWPAVAEWRAVPAMGIAVVDTAVWRLIKDWSSVSEAP